jgi:hypothetical protein
MPRRPPCDSRQENDVRFVESRASVEPVRFQNSAMGSNLADSCLWVPETLHTSRDLLILVEQSTESVAPLDGVRIVRRWLGEWS